jgi:hypothetical protein
LAFAAEVKLKAKAKLLIAAKVRKLRCMISLSNRSAKPGVVQRLLRGLFHPDELFGQSSTDFVHFWTIAAHCARNAPCNILSSPPRLKT